MKRWHSSSKSSLFLLELIMAILFFACSSAICIQFFARSHILSNRTSDINMAINAVQSAAESFKYIYSRPPADDVGAQDSSEAFHSRLSGIESLLGAIPISDRSVVVGYDSRWQPATFTGEARFLLTVVVDDDTALASALITMTDTKDDLVLYEVTAKKYQYDSRKGSTP